MDLFSIIQLHQQVSYQTPIAFGMDVFRASTTWKVMLTERLFILCILCLVPGCVPLHYECTPRNPGETSVGIANCSSQSLEHVPPNLPHNIKILDLSNNKIKHLMDNSFVKYESLQILHMKNNSLRSLQVHAFARMRQLLYLDMSYNDLGVIPTPVFKDLTNLLTLSLSGNKISVIQRNTFENVSHLTNLFLSGNHIEYIHPDAFVGLNRLQRLELQNNALTTLDHNSLRYFTSELQEIKLHNNPWFCDCSLRGLFKWLKNASENDSHNLKWIFNTKEPVCRGPSLVKGHQFSTLSSEIFLCKITMYLPGRNIEVVEGGDAVLTCKYMADPPVPTIWMKNGQPMTITEKSKKYNTVSKGLTMIVSTLYIHNFKYRDIGEYQCYTENQLGKAFVSFLVTLEGVDPDLLDAPQQEETKDDKNRVRNAVIASSTIGGVVFLLILIGVTAFLLIRCREYRKKKRESIRLTFEEQLKANGIIEPNPKSDPIIYDEVPDSTLSLDAEMDEPESMYDSLRQPRNPSSTNTNTYISFKTEFSEPEDMTQLYSTSRAAKGSEGSQCESTSPLLENISPILIDPHDPFFEATLYIPRLNSYTRNYLNSTQTNHYDTYHPASRTQTLPHGYLPHNMAHDFNLSSPKIVRSASVSANHKSASVGNLGMNPPKKPPRLFHSRDSMSLLSQNSRNGDSQENGPKLSLPKPGTVDQYGTAV